jgi:hypothetical protein
MTTPKIATALNVGVLSVFLLVSPAYPQSAVNTGTLQLSVKDTGSKPITGAMVRYRRIPKTMVVANTRTNVYEVPAPGEAMFYGETAVDESGNLTVSGLPAGSYSLCARVPSSAYFDPCLWQQPLVVAISANTTTAQALVLNRGVSVKIRLNDPNGLLPQVVDGVWTPHKISVGVVYAHGAYQAAPNTGVDAAGRDYQLTVPAGVPFTLRLFSHDIALADQSGTALDMSGSKIPFQGVTGQDQAFTFSVSGPMGH